HLARRKLRSVFMYSAPTANGNPPAGISNRSPVSEAPSVCCSMSMTLVVRIPIALAHSWVMLPRPNGLNDAAAHVSRSTPSKRPWSRERETFPDCDSVVLVSPQLPDTSQL